MNEVEKVLAVARDRRNFITNVGLATAVAGIAGSANLLEAQSAAPTDIDILNFALNLEYLEAEYYTVATSGLTIDYFEVAITGSGTAGPTTGLSQTVFTDPITFKIALELAADERTHVSLLQSAITSLGGTPIAKPAINLSALGAFTSQTTFLTLARAFEEIGVTAYSYAANLITSKAILGYAARILAAEAEHVGYIRARIAAAGITVMPLDAVDLIPPPAGAQYFSLNSSALCAIRSPGQVLALAFGGALSTAAGGGFFPSGVNGNLNTSASATAVTDLVTFTLSPNPSIGQGSSVPMTITWSAPGVSRVSIRLGSPSGNYFIYGPTSGTMTTPAWVQDGLVFYLQNATNFATERTSASTLAIAIAHVT